MQKEEIALLEAGEDPGTRSTQHKRSRPLLSIPCLLVVCAVLLIVVLLRPVSTSVSRNKPSRPPRIHRTPFKRHDPRGRPHSSFEGPTNRQLRMPNEREALTDIFRDAASLVENTDHAPVSCYIGVEHRARFRAMQSSGHNVLIVASYSNSVNVLLTVLHELTALVSFMGADRVHVAITEGGSTDYTPELLHHLARALLSIGGTFSIRSKGDTEKPAWDQPGQRIEILADARNWPLDHLEDQAGFAMDGFDSVLMLNDVVFCAVDALELLYQRVAQDADAMCALDYNRWNWVGSKPLAFYDSWVARTIEGKTFWDIKPTGNMYDGSLDFQNGLLVTSPTSKLRYEALQPFQVFSCWNGALAVRAEPLLSPYSVRLRSLPTQQVSESYVFNQDLWLNGFGRIAVAPRARVGYEREHYELIGMLNHTKGLADAETIRKERISHWQTTPPSRVEYYDEHSFWVPAMRSWNWLPEGVTWR